MINFPVKNVVQGDLFLFDGNPWLEFDQIVIAIKTTDSCANYVTITWYVVPSDLITPPVVKTNTYKDRARLYNVTCLQSMKEINK